MKKLVFFCILAGGIALTSCGKKTTYVSIPLGQESQYKIGEDYMDNGKYESAMDYFQKELNNLNQTNDQETPDAAKLYYDMGVCLRRLGEIDASIEYLEKAIAIHRTHAINESLVDDYLSISIAYQELEEYETALDYMDKATQLSNQLWGSDSLDSAELMKSASFIYMDIGNNEEALELLENALMIEKKYGEEFSDSVGRTYLGLGTVYRNMKNYEKAKDAYESAIKVMTNVYGDMDYNTGECYLGMGMAMIRIDSEKAISYLEKAIAIYETDEQYAAYEAQTYSAIEFIYEDRKEYEKAIPYAIKVREITESSPYLNSEMKKQRYEELYRIFCKWRGDKTGEGFDEWYEENVHLK